MCGIAGILYKNTDITPNLIQNMVQSLEHRGPDEQNWIYLPNCHLGHSRLSIIDLTSGQQPMTEATDRYWIVFNGEIYNYRELRQELEKQGCKFRTQSDTEVILQGYITYGEGITTHLNGQFAFAIWDTTEQKLFAARDRFGEKPFYYAQTSSGHLIFASELKAILSTGLLQSQLSLAAVDAYLALLYVPPTQCIYQNIQVLPPAHQLIWQQGQLTITQYWHPNFTETSITFEEAIEELQMKLKEAVHRQMVTADVPVGALLSGGIDSSSVVSLMQEMSSSPVKTFSVGFGNLINELPYARAIAKKYKTEHYEMQMDINLAQEIQRMTKVYDEPFADSSNIPTYLIAKLVREHVKVVLSGDGGDELFGGYGAYVSLEQAGKVPANLLYLTLMRLLYRLAGQFGFEQRKKLGYQIVAIKQTRSAETTGLARHIFQATYLSATERQSLWQHRSQEAMSGSLYLPQEALNTLPVVNQAMYFDTTWYLPGDILVKVDRATMAHGLESRAPFLDVALAEFALSLPYRLKIDNFQTKVILRQATKHLLPAKLINRPKQGFGAPVVNWLKKPEIEPLLQKVFSKQSALSHLLPGIPKKAVTNSYQGWILLVLGLWLEEHAECLHDV